MSSSVLIIEDEKVLQDVYKLILTAKGYKVITADNGIEGLTALKKHKPDVVLLDIFMPVMDGREVLRNLDKKDYPNTKIIVYSNLSDPETEREVIEHGADKFILKSSLAPQDLVRLVNELVK